MRVDVRPLDEASDTASHVWIEEISGSTDLIIFEHSHVTYLDQQILGAPINVRDCARYASRTITFVQDDKVTEAVIPPKNGLVRRQQGFECIRNAL